MSTIKFILLNTFANKYKEKYTRNDDYLPKGPNAIPNLRGYTQNWYTDGYDTPGVTPCNEDQECQSNEICMANSCQPYF